MFLFREPDIGRESLTDDSDIASTVHRLEHDTSVATVVDTEHRSFTLIVCRAFTTCVEHSLRMCIGIRVIGKITQAYHLAKGDIVRAVSHRLEDSEIVEACRTSLFALSVVGKEPKAHTLKSLQLVREFAASLL